MNDEQGRIRLDRSGMTAASKLRSSNASSYTCQPLNEAWNKRESRVTRNAVVTCIHSQMYISIRTTVRITALAPNDDRPARHPSHRPFLSSHRRRYRYLCQSRQLRPLIEEARTYQTIESRSGGSTSVPSTSGRPIRRISTQHNSKTRPAHFSHLIQLTPESLYHLAQPDFPKPLTLTLQLFLSRIFRRRLFRH